MNMQEKYRILDEAKANFFEFLERGPVKNDEEARELHDKVLTPLVQFYNKEIMELINPVNKLTQPVIAFVLESTANALRTDMDEADEALLNILKHSYQGISVAVPHNRENNEE